VSAAVSMTTADAIRSASRPTEAALSVDVSRDIDWGSTAAHVVVGIRAVSRLLTDHIFYAPALTATCAVSGADDISKILPVLRV